MLERARKNRNIRRAITGVALVTDREDFALRKDAFLDSFDVVT